MCYESITISAPPGSGQTTSNPTGPILSVDDPRWNDDTVEMRRRKRMLAAIMEWMAQVHVPSVVAPGETTLAPNYVGQEAPIANGPYTAMAVSDPTLWYGGDSCTTINNKIRETVDARGGAWGADCRSHPAWVPYKAGQLPSVGDVFNLVDDTNTFHHCGTVLQVSIEGGGPTMPKCWLTGDGGQRQPPIAEENKIVTASYIAARSPVCYVDDKKIERLELRNWMHRYSTGYFLAGWIPITSKSIYMWDGPLNAATEEKYKKAVARIKRVNDAAVAEMKL